MKKLQLKTSFEKKLKRGGITGIALGIVALIACELPIILAIIGLGGFSAGMAAFRLPVFVEVIGIGLFVIGAGVLVYFYKKRVSERREARDI